MDKDFNSTDRKSSDYIIFALGFLGFIVAGAGVVASSALVAGTGATVLLLSVLRFRD